MAARPRKRRTENAARRTLQMVEATLRSVARNGLNGTTLASVSNEAGLSQGVAVFYFESKNGLLAAAFRHHYQIYHQNWQEAAHAAGPDPAARIAAVISADFSPIVFNRKALAIWYAFWGESTARPIYGEISDEFDRERNLWLGEQFSTLLGTDIAEGRILATEIDALTDGFWLRAHLTQPWIGAEKPLRATASAISRLIPGPGTRIAELLEQPNGESRQALP